MGENSFISSLPGLPKGFALSPTFETPNSFFVFVVHHLGEYRSHKSCVHGGKLFAILWYTLHTVCAAI